MHYEPGNYLDSRKFGSPFGPNALIRNQNATNLTGKKGAFLIHVFLYRGLKGDHQKVKLPPYS